MINYLLKMIRVIYVNNNAYLALQVHRKMFNLTVVFYIAMGNYIVIVKHLIDILIYAYERCLRNV